MTVGDDVPVVVKLGVIEPDSVSACDCDAPVVAVSESVCVTVGVADCENDFVGNWLGEKLAVVVNVGVREELLACDADWVGV